MSLNDQVFLLNLILYIMLQNILNLEGVVTLDKKAQGSIKGGGTCAVLVDGAAFSGLSKDHVFRILATNGGGRWCCDSCGGASWL